MRSLGYMPNEVELEVIIQRLDMDGEHCPLSVSSPFTWGLSLSPLPATPKLGSLQPDLAPFLSPENLNRGQSVTAPATP